MGANEGHHERAVRKMSAAGRLLTRSAQTSALSSLNKMYTSLTLSSPM